MRADKMQFGQQLMSNVLFFPILQLEPVLVSLLRLDPLSHWKIVGNALHGLHTLSLNPKCARAIAQSADIERTLFDTLSIFQQSVRVSHYEFGRP